MSDLISRQEAIDAICEHGTDLERRGITVLAVANHKQATVDLLEKLPSAEQHGKWIIYPVSPWDGEDVKCSVCGEKGCASYWNYCPHCGSQMDLEDEE